MFKKYYAVKKGRIPGIYETWSECQEQVEKYPGAVYKGFKTKEEAGVLSYSFYSTHRCHT